MSPVRWLLPLSLVACAAPPPELVVHVTGEVALRPDGTWSGAEERSLVDEAGECRVVYELELSSALDVDSCEGCSLVLHLVNAVEQPERSACDEPLFEAESVPRNLGFVPEPRGEGDLLGADSLAGPWYPWSDAALGDGVLSWAHDARPDREPGFDEDDLRPRQEPPVVK